MTVEVLARAKINLHLGVGRRGADGYHEIASIMQSVDLADTVTVSASRAGAGAPSVAFERAPGYAGALPESPDLVERALGLYVAEGLHVAEGLSVGVGLSVGEWPGAAFSASVTKAIPMGAGLAGGSADAAAALLGATSLDPSPPPRERLEALCRRLGADVLFCLRGGTALVEGWGNLVSPLPCPHRLWWVLGISSFPLGTADVYRRFDELGLEDAAGGGRGRPERPVKLARALVTGHPKEIAACLRNDLEVAAFDLAPTLPALRKELLSAGAIAATMCGSGPTIAGLCRNEAHVEEVAARASAAFDRVEVVASAGLGAEVV